MVYRVYPIILGSVSVLLTAVGFVGVLACLPYRWPLVGVPFLAAIGGLVISSLVASRFPRIRYVNDSEIEGLGYVHQPLDAILPVFLFGIFAALVINVREWTS